MTKFGARVEAIRILAREAEIYVNNGNGEWSEEERDVLYPALLILGAALAEEADRTEAREARRG